MGSLFPPDAPAISDVLAVAEVALGALLIGGLVLARTGHIRAHRALQSSIVLVNIPLVLYGMLPNYVEYVLPNLGTQLAQAATWVPTFMLVAGALAEVFGVYIILVAGTDWIPSRFRFRSYKLWMRTELALWWSVVVAGLVTYWLFFVPGAAL